MCKFDFDELALAECSGQFNFIDVIGIKRVLDRGTGIVLEESGAGIFLYDTVSEAVMIACDDKSTALNWFEAHENDERINGGQGYELINICGGNYVEDIKLKYHLETVLDCHQAAYFGEKFDVSDIDIEFYSATYDDIELIYSVYQKISREELEQVISRKNLYLGKKDGQIVGFIGEHLEGSAGLLNIFPEYRRNGYGAALEKMMINYTLENGNIPFCQIETYNDKSMMLQSKLGLEISDGHVYWLV